MDKLKYIKLENEDGSYSDAIPLSVDPAYIPIISNESHITLDNYIETNDSNINVLQTDTENNKNSISSIKVDLSNKATKTELNNSINSLTEQMAALENGSPKGSYETTAALISANPNTGVYIVTTDGHIYSWTKNASAAIDLGVYQATEISSDSIVTVMERPITARIVGPINYEKLGWNSGGITDEGDSYQVSTRCRSSGFYITGGHHHYISIKNKNNNLAYRIFCYSGGIFSSSNLLSRTEWQTKSNDFKINTFRLVANPANEDYYRYTTVIKIEVKTLDDSNLSVSEVSNSIDSAVFQFYEDEILCKDYNARTDLRKITSDDIRADFFDSKTEIRNIGIFVKAGSIIKVKKTNLFKKFIVGITKRPYRGFDLSTKFGACSSYLYYTAVVDDTDYNLLMVSEDGYLQFLLKKSDNSVFEGDIADYYGEINECLNFEDAYTINKSCIFNSNMINKSLINAYAYITTSGNSSSSIPSPTGFDSCTFIPAIGNAEVYLKGLTSPLSDGQMISFYNSNRSLISYIKLNDQNYIRTTTPEGTAEIGINLRKSEIENTGFYFLNTIFDKEPANTENVDLRIDVLDSLLNNPNIELTELGSGYIGASGSYGTSNAWKLYYAPISEGIEYLISTGMNGIDLNGHAKAAACFYSVDTITSSNYTTVMQASNVVEIEALYSERSAHWEDIKKVAPDGAKSIVICLGSSYFNIGSSLKALPSLSESACDIVLKDYIDFNEIVDKYSDGPDESDSYAYIFNESFSIAFTKPLSSSNMIIKSFAKWVGEEKPTIKLSSTNGSTIDYTIGKDYEFHYNEWRVPPILKNTDVITLTITIPEGTVLYLKEFSNYYEQSRTSWAGGVKLNCHLGCYYLGAPENTMPAYQIGAQLGYPACIAVPKVTADGIFVCLHDDNNINRTARNADGTAVSGSYKVSDLTYEQLLEYDFGLYKGAYWKGTKIPLLSDFFELCAKTNMQPMFSTHPNLTSSQWEEVKAMLIKYGLLKRFHIKSFDLNALKTAYTVFGTEIDGYTWDGGNVTSMLANASEMDNTKCRIGIEYHISSINQTEVQNALNNGYFTAAYGIGRNVSGDRYKELISWGVTEFTDDCNPCHGLNW